MTNFPILDLVVGIIFFYFLLSVISNAVIEMLMTYSRARATVLEDWFKTIFDGKSALVKDIMNHPAVTALSDKSKTPSYISAANFVTALLDKVNSGVETAAKAKTVLEEMENNITASTALTPEMKSMLLLYAKEARSTYDAIATKTQSDIDIFRKKIENWYDSSMERLTGTIKKKYARGYTIYVAICITLLMNADTISISAYLYNNPEVRVKLAGQAITAAKSEEYKALTDSIKAHVTPGDTVTVQELEKQLKERSAQVEKAYAAINGSIPLGWKAIEFEAVSGGGGWSFFILSKLVGLAVTVLAICLGAPFWFDMLNKIANLRGTGKPPEPEKK
jgi:hypothetical protein